MAGITAQDRGQMLRISKWLGLNEAQDGDTNLKLGELSVMENMRITREGHLQKRPGSKTKLDLSEAFAAYTGEKAEDPKPCGAWYGTVAGKEQLVVAYGGVIFRVDTAEWTAHAIGSMTQAETSFFPFSGKLYFLNGNEYKVWDGETFGEVAGYVPVIVTAATPAGGGTQYTVKFRYHRANCASTADAETAWAGEINNCGWVQVDVNGKSKPNVVGKDIFFLALMQDGFIPFHATDNKINDCKKGTGISCSSLYINNGGQSFNGAKGLN